MVSTFQLSLQQSREAVGDRRKAGHVLFYLIKMRTIYDYFFHY
jgi:hypothetical protein